MQRKVFIFDTTLRDGEQSPGASLTASEKLEIARQLERLGVDVIEAGFPSSSPGDFEAVREIAREVKGPVITALARAVASDIDAVWQSVREAQRPRIHIVLGASDIHARYKFGRSREDLLRMGVEAVRYARGLCPEVRSLHRGRLPQRQALPLPGDRGRNRGGGDHSQRSGHGRLGGTGPVGEADLGCPPDGPEHRQGDPQRSLP